MLRISIRIIVAILTIAYVVLGTLFALSLYARDNLSSFVDWSNPSDFMVILSVITYPAYVISFGIRFAQSDLLWPVYIIQFVTLVLFLYLADYMVRRIFRFFDETE